MGGEGGHSEGTGGMVAPVPPPWGPSWVPIWGPWWGVGVFFLMVVGWEIKSILFGGLGNTNLARKSPPQESFAGAIKKHEAARGIMRSTDLKVAQNLRFTGHEPKILQMSVQLFIDSYYWVRLDCFDDWIFDTKLLRSLYCYR